MLFTVNRRENWVTDVSPKVIQFGSAHDWNLNPERLNYKFHAPFTIYRSFSTLDVHFVVSQSLSLVLFFVTPRLQHTSLLCPLLSSGVGSNSCSLSLWWYLTISSSAALFSFCLQSFPASVSFPTSRLFASGGQSIGASASASVIPVNIQGWLPWRLTGLILWSKRLSRVFSSITIQKHQFFFGDKPSLWFDSHTCTWCWKKDSFD